MKCSCPHCTTGWQVQGLISGQRLSCPQCGAKVVVRNRRSDATAERQPRFGLDKRTFGVAAALVGAVACVGILVVVLAIPRAGEEAVAQGGPVTVPVAIAARPEDPGTDRRNAREEPPEKAKAP